MHTTAIIKFQVEQALLLGKAFLKQQQLQQAQEQYNIQKKINIISITKKTINIDNFFEYSKEGLEKDLTQLEYYLQKLNNPNVIVDMTK